MNVNTQNGRQVAKDIAKTLKTDRINDIHKIIKEYLKKYGVKIKDYT